MLGDRLGGRTHLCPDVVGLFLALHILFLPHSRDLTQLVDYEYSRNRYIGQQVREPIKEKREEPTPWAEGGLRREAVWRNVGTPEGIQVPSESLGLSIVGHSMM